MSKTSIIAPFESSILGALKNRVVMAPMTRSFATVDHCCTPDIAAYYERRTRDGVGLILTEGIIVHPSGDGYNSVTYLHTKEQMQSWRKVVDDVHQHGTKIYAQLWHCGRISHPDYTNGYDVVSSTNNAAAGINRQNNKPYGIPRALCADEMASIYDMFCHSAELAVEAGFDGVELHMGHGYLVDQFLDARINDRTDQYGGSIENRCRFAIELLEKVIDRIGSNRVMVRISPSRMMGGLYEWPDLYEMLDFLVEEFKSCGLRQLDISCANADYFKTSGKIVRYIRKQWPYLIVGGASLSIADAEQEIAEGCLDLVTWGRAIIANPDFVTRVTRQIDLQPFDDSMRAKLI
jgi:N-ethylmaleimide reductase